MAEKVALQEEISLLERKKRRLRRDVEDTEDKIMLERQQLIDSLKKKAVSQSATQHLFTFKWRLQ